jgi:hypothetical protein
MLARNLDELAQDVASAVRAEVDFYKTTRAVADDDLLASCTENIRFALKSLGDGVDFDTSPAVTTGTRRAAAGIPVPAVMDAYRIASYRLWDAVVDIATENRGISRDMVIEGRGGFGAFRTSTPTQWQAPIDSRRCTRSWRTRPNAPR